MASLSVGLESLSAGIARPSLNQGEFLCEALGSILVHGDRSLKIGLCDGGSVDETESILESYRDHLTYLRSHPAA